MTIQCICIFSRFFFFSFPFLIQHVQIKTFRKLVMKLRAIHLHKSSVIKYRFERKYQHLLSTNQLRSISIRRLPGCVVNIHSKVEILQSSSLKYSCLYHYAALCAETKSVDYCGVFCFLFCFVLFGLVWLFVCFVLFLFLFQLVSVFATCFLFLFLFVFFPSCH